MKTVKASELSDAEFRAGLDKPLPAGEKILWQARPSARHMGAVVFRFRLVAIYLAALVGITVAFFTEGGWPLGPAIAMGLLAIPAGLIGMGALALIGVLMARTSCYTLTNRRIILHIGVSFDRTISIPLSAVTNARIRPRGRKGMGDLAFEVKDVGGLNYMNLWPHARALHFMPPQPALRALPDVKEACDAIGDALVAFNTAPRPVAAPVETRVPHARPALAEAAA